LLFKASKLLINQSNGIGNNLSVFISSFSSVHIVSGFLFTLFISVLSGFRNVLDSEINIFEGGFGLEDVVIDAGQFSFGVGKGSGGNDDGDVQEVEGLLVGLDSLVFSKSLQVERVFDLGEQVVAQLDDVVNGSLVGQLFSSGGDGGKGLEEFSP
jgi:hypothetical protein